jgi:hypothetical protein
MLENQQGDFRFDRSPHVAQTRSVVRAGGRGVDLRRIPPAVLVALGLEACIENEVSACLSMVPSTDGSDGGTSSSASSGSEGTDSLDESDVGPCLGQVPTTEGTGTGSTDATGSTDESDSTGTSGTDDGSDTSTGPCLEPKGDALPEPDNVGTAVLPHAHAWADAFARVSASLPADVAARLGKRGQGGSP